jgi:hypothetical protein
MSDNASAEAQSLDPLKTVAEAMDGALQAVHHAAVDAKAAFDKGLPGVKRFVSQFVYKTCYTISYCVVFPAVLVARSIPKDNPIVHGLVDGAHTAVERVHETKKRNLEAKASDPPLALTHS